MSKNITRDNKKILSEYNLKWRNVKKFFSQVHSNNFLIDQKKYFESIFPKNKGIFYKNKLYFYEKKIINNFDNFYQIKFNYINSLILDYIKDFDEIVDLGSGWGDRILCIKPYLRSNVRIYSGEFTNNGISTQKFLIKKYKFKNIKNFHFDFNDFNKIYKFKLKNPVFTTFNSIEQITFLKDGFLKNLKKKFNLKNINILHLEPVGFQITRKNKFDPIVCKYNKINGYNMNLIKIIKKEKVKNFKIKKNIYSVIDSKSNAKTSSVSLITYKV